MTRFFVQPDQIHEDHVLLSAEDAHHLLVVLHARLGDPIAVLDGSGREWPGTLKVLTKTRAEAVLGASWDPNTEPRTQITVAQALPKMAEKMEQVLQRGTEIGVRQFWVYESARSMTHLTGERQAKRLGRWQEIIKTAAEQAHRSRLPALEAGGGWDRLTTQFPLYGRILLLHPSPSAQPLRALMRDNPSAVLVIVGPESGFTEGEIRSACAAGAQRVSLGPRVLRTETAALVAASQILYALEADHVC